MIRNKLIAISTTVMILGLSACGEHTHHESSHHDTKAKHQTTDAHSLPDKIDLNNGKKWVVNDEMIPYVKEGEQALDTYMQSDQKDYKTLAANLETANKKLISSCTMEGKSHDELHKWLHPHMELVSDLANTDDPTQADQLIEKLKQSYQNYHNHFQ